MDLLSTPRKRKRTQRTDLQSRYFSTSPQLQNRHRQSDAHNPSLRPEQLQLLNHTNSRFFQPKLDIDTLLANPAFLLFYHDFLDAFQGLYNAKPVLIQGPILPILSFSS